MRSATRCVSSWRSHAFCEHQHWYDVRTGESWSPARLRANWSAQVDLNASRSSAVRKFSNVMTHGACAPSLPPPPGRLSAVGRYCGKSRRMRTIVSLMPPAATMGGVSAGRSHERRFCSQAWHETAHCSSMNVGLCTSASRVSSRVSSRGHARGLTAWHIRPRAWARHV